MKVTAEDLVQALKSNFYEETINMALETGEFVPPYSPFDELGNFVEAVFFLAKRITLPEPTPTIPGTINGTPATFEVVYRAED